MHTNNPTRSLTGLADTVKSARRPLQPDENLGHAVPLWVLLAGADPRGGAAFERPLQ